METMKSDISDISSLLNSVSTQLELSANYIGAYLSSLNGTKVAAIVLFLIAIVMALSLVLVWYIKSIIVSIQLDKKQEREILSRVDYRLDKGIVTDDEPLAFCEEDDVNARLRNESNIKQLRKNKNRSKRLNPLDLDWDREAFKGQVDTLKNTPNILEYQLKPQKMTTLIGLILDMLERGVDEPKIAQTIMYKNQHLNTEEDIIEVVSAIRLFVAFCNEGVFKGIKTDKILPQEDVAIFHLINADTSLGVAILEVLIDDKMAKLKNVVSEQDRSRAFAELSQYARVLGSFAYINNLTIAEKAFELAIELNPNNVTAWGRLGDVYSSLDKVEKAVWAYSNVLNIAEEKNNARQIANAHQRLASYYIENGQRSRAEDMLKSSNDFYDAIGINAPLNDKEIAAIDIIEIKQDQNMESLVERVLKSKNFRLTTKTL